MHASPLRQAVRTRTHRLVKSSDRVRKFEQRTGTRNRKRRVKLLIKAFIVVLAFASLAFVALFTACGDDESDYKASYTFADFSYVGGGCDDTQKFTSSDYHLKDGVVVAHTEACVDRSGMSAFAALSGQFFDDLQSNQAETLVEFRDNYSSRMLKAYGQMPAGTFVRLKGILYVR